MTDSLDIVIYNIFAQMVFSHKTHFSIHKLVFFHTSTGPLPILICDKKKKKSTTGSDCTYFIS